MPFETQPASDPLGRAAAPEPGSVADVLCTWNARADLYLELFRHELDGKPFDRELLAAFAARLGTRARVVDAGCGPCGHVAAFLAEHGLDVLGVDLSPRCIELARLEQPGIRFEVMDQRAVAPAVNDGPLDGLVSYYSLHDQPKRELPDTLAAWAAAIRPGGRLLVVAKEGAGDGVIDDPLGTGIRVYWAEYSEAELRSAAEVSGFVVDELTARDAYDDEIRARRIALSATRR
ncbi:class I SAM-dependent methyltransferase [Agromyces laixinhei]|uniref:class I SAM-dependent methyltransferase n=1 Tax=Agromyces laixinhei TaxID=2585717 RepID=UPI001115F483|nr:class I SAM-dependent methyltransferase [Agromyces laixinhei]